MLQRRGIRNGSNSSRKTAKGLEGRGPWAAGGMAQPCHHRASNTFLKKLVSEKESHRKMERQEGRLVLEAD